MVRTAAAILLFLFAAEVRCETVDVKYRGFVDPKRLPRTATAAASFSAFVAIESAELHNH